MLGLCLAGPKQFLTDKAALVSAIAQLKLVEHSRWICKSERKIDRRRCLIGAVDLEIAGNCGHWRFWLAAWSVAAA